MIKTLLGVIPVVTPDANTIHRDEWELITFHDSLTWPCEEMDRAIKQDAQWCAFSRARGNHNIPDGAFRLDAAGDGAWPLRVEDEAGVCMIGPSDNPKVNKRWEEAPYEIEIFVTGSPRYLVIPCVHGFRRKFDANGAVFFSRIVRRVEK